MLNSVLNPFPIFVAVALGILGSLALFWTLKIELTRQSRRQLLRERMLEGNIRILETNLESMQREMQASSLRPPASDLSFPGNSLNFTKRSQALRLLRRGQGVEHVAAVLNVPRQEVELLVKVYQLTG